MVRIRACGFYTGHILTAILCVLEFKVCSIKDTIAAKSTETSGSFENKITKCVWFPLYKE